VSSRGELKEVEAGDAAELDSGEVAEGLLNTVVGLVDNKGSTTKGVTPVTGLTLSGADLLRVSGLLDISEGTDTGKDVLGGRGLLGGLNGVVNDKRNLGHIIDLVSTCHHEGRDGRGSKSGGNSITPLGSVDLAMPLPPRLGGSEHASTTTHVTEGTLSGPGGTSSSDTGDTGDGASSSPGGSGDLLSGPGRDGVSLTVVLAHVGVHELDNVGTHGSGHDSGEGGLTGFLSGEGEDRY